MAEPELHDVELSAVAERLLRECIEDGVTPAMGGREERAVSVLGALGLVTVQQERRGHVIRFEATGRGRRWLMRHARR